MHSTNGTHDRQAGIALVASLLLLLVVTIMALSIFRSFGIQEKIAGNMREKQRALQSAVSTQKYAEYWLANQSYAPKALGLGIVAAADVICNTLVDANLNPGPNGGQICSNTLPTALGVSVAAWPTSTNDIGAVYTPPNMNVTNNYAGAATNPSVSDLYYKRPRFYITDMGPLNSGTGEVYKVDAYSYGLNATGLAVVESTLTISCVTGCNRGGL